MGIGSQIKSLRTARGLTQEQLAKTLYVSRQTILNWEQGRTTPDAQSLLLLSALFGVTVDTLMRGDVNAMDDVLSARSGLSRKTLLVGAAIGFAGSALLLVPLTEALGLPGCALSLVPAITSIAGMALVAKSSRPAASIETLRAGLERPTSLVLTCSGRRNVLSAVATDSEGNMLFRIDRSGNVPRGQSWDVADESGNRIAVVRHRSIAVGNPCPFIKAKIDGIGVVKMEKTVSMATEFRSVWKLSGAGIGIEGDWLGDTLEFTRNGEPLARIHAGTTREEASDVKETYHVEAANGLLCGVSVVLAFMLALVRDLERSLV